MSLRGAVVLAGLVVMTAACTEDSASQFASGSTTSTSSKSTGGSGGMTAAGGGVVGGGGAVGTGGAGGVVGTGGAGGVVGTGGAGGGSAATCPGSAPGCVVDWAGKFGVQADTDGVGQAARFQFVSGITSAGGYLYVSSNHAIRRIDMATATVTTWAGASGQSGYNDAAGAAARFDTPIGLATDGSKLWVSDAGNHVIREIDMASKQVTTLAGQQGVNGNADGAAASATFDGMRDLTFDGTDLYLVESVAVVRHIDLNSMTVSTVAGSYNNPGLVDGTGNVARFEVPRFIEAVSAGSLFVGDTENHRPRRLLMAGISGSVTSPYGSSQGFQNGNGNSAQFDRLRGIAFDGTNLIVSDSDNYCLRHIDLKTHEATTLAGMAGTPQHVVGVGTQAGFDKPLSLHYDAPSGDLFISEGTVIRRMYYK